jgi:uncharacterized membrane protein YdfJ with MMPL/SSD domain
VVLVSWMVLIVTLAVLGKTAGSAYSNTFSIPGTGSANALNLLTRAFPGHAGDQDSIVWKVSSGTVESPAVKARITAMLAKVEAAPSVASVISPYSGGGSARISQNGTIAYATVLFDTQAANLSKPDVNRVVSIAETAREPGLQVELGGQAIGNAERPSAGTSTGIGLLAAAVVLFIAFGSLFAMLLPLAVAIAGLVSGLMAIALFSHAVSVPSIGPTMATLIALGVGIDYALFVVTRHLRQRRSRRQPSADHLPRGRGHEQPYRPAPHQRHPRRRERHLAGRLHRRYHRHLRRLRHRDQPQAPAVPRGHHRARVPAAAGLPQSSRACRSGRDERTRRRGILRRHGRGLLVGLGRAFILSGQQVIGEFGLGLAAAVLLDAFILRTILVPAFMHLFGRVNWWLPRWLDRALPHLSIEPADEAASQAGPLPGEPAHAGSAR